MFLWEQNASGVETHIAGVYFSTPKASLDKKNWTFDHKRSSCLPGHSTDLSASLSLVLIFLYMKVSVISQPAPPAVPCPASWPF